MTVDFILVLFFIIFAGGTALWAVFGPSAPNTSLGDDSAADPDSSSADRRDTF